MNETDAAELLDRLGEGFPDRMPAAVELLVAGLAARRRRTTRAVVAAAAAVVLLVAGGSLAVGLTRSPDGQATPIDSARPVGSDIPQPPAGMRWAGRGRVVVAVPASWVDTNCPQGFGSPYVFDGPFGCRGPMTAPADHLYVLSFGGGASLLGHTEVVAPLAGVRVRQSQATCGTSVRGFCDQAVLIPSLDFYLQIVTRSPDVLARIRSSLRVLPPGFVFRDGAIVRVVPSGPVASVEPVLGQWQAVTVGGRTLLPGEASASTLRLTTDDGGGHHARFVSAEDGCGSAVSGTWSVDHGRLTIDPVRAHRLVRCLRPVVAPVTEVFTTASRLALAGDRLVLLDADGAELATYERR